MVGLNVAVPRRALRLTTERLIIRPLSRSDITEFTRYRNDPDVARYQDWTLPYTRDLAHTVVDDADAVGVPTGGQWLQLGITDASDRLLGDVAVWLDDDELLAVIGYTLARHHQGKGYASEAVAALLDWLFTVCQDPPCLGHDRPAEPAIGAGARAQRVPLHRDRPRRPRVRGEWTDDARFELLADDWRAWKRRPGPPRRVELAEITPETVRRIGALDRGFSQRRFVSSVYQSYGDTLIAPDHDGEQVRPWYRAINADGEPVGFMMLAEPTADQPHPYLWRFMIDWRHQGRGIGRATLRELATLRAATGATHLLLSCVAGVPGSPEPFYRRLGFERTGHVNEWGETEMIAPLDRLIDGDARPHDSRSRKSTSPPRARRPELAKRPDRRR